jgi:hypothetical protein
MPNSSFNRRRFLQGSLQAGAAIADIQHAAFELNGNDRCAMHFEGGVGRIGRQVDRAE